ncbi:hypothetical protein BU15DRAFT_76487 [Melanogaster broomeanus]|nr:hypothetical protein BU15DRAFT_76487 [Melanogaster broomeanus]
MDNSFPAVSDFVIVGGGTAGLVLPRRLSEAGHSVHVLEAGPRIKSLSPEQPAVPFDETGQLNLKDAMSMPGLHGSWQSPRWFKQLEPHNMDERRCSRLRSDCKHQQRSILEVRAMKKYFKKSETFLPDSSKSFDRENYGYDGPIHVVPVDASRRGYSLSDCSHRAWEAAGFKYNGYSNDGNTLGFSTLGQSIDSMNGGRQSRSKYIENFGPAIFTSPNFRMVASIIFQDKKAIGVKTVGGVTYKASKEVCYAPVDYVRLRYCSTQELETNLTSSNTESQLSITSRVSDENLWDHPLHLPQMGRARKSLRKYNQKQGGLLEGPSYEFSAWKNYAHACQQAVVLDDESGSVTVHALPTHSRLYHVQTAPLTPKFLMLYEYPHSLENITGSYFTLLSTVATPTVEGLREKLFRTTPVLAPECDPKWLSTQMVDEDGTPVIAAEVDFTGNPPALGFSEEDLETKLRTSLRSAFHYAGTCAMAPLDSTSPLPVVDTDCKVYGVQGLRVVDASVFPVPISANTQAPVYALAEKIADAILGDYPLGAQS